MKTKRAARDAESQDRFMVGRPLESPQRIFMAPTSFHRALSFLLLLPVVALAILACILSLQIRSLQSSAAWVDHSDLVIAQMNELTRLMIDGETGIRGYQLTGQKRFLEPYNIAQREIGTHYRDLQRLVQNNPSQVERLRQLSAYNDVWKASATWRLAPGKTQEQLVTESLRAKADMDQIRAEAAKFIDDEGALKAKRASHALFHSRSTYAVLTLLAALVAALISVFTRRAFRALDSQHQSKVATMQAQHAWLSTTLLEIGDAVIACNPDGRVVFMNGVAENLTGWAEGEAKGKALQEIFHIVNEHTRADVESPVHKALRLGAAVGLTRHAVLVRKDGSEIAIDDSGAPIRDVDGQISGVVLVFRDVSGRRAVDHAIRQSEAESRARAAELEAIMQMVPALILVAHDPKCERITSNRLAYSFLRFPLGTNFSPLVPPAQRPQHFRAMQNGRELRPEEMPLQMAAATGRVIRDVELTRVFDDGSSCDEVGSAAPLFDDNGAVRGAVGAFIDITVRKRAEETLRKTEKLAAVGRLAANLSHEINNPLETVTNLLYLIQRTSSLSQVREYTKTAQQELARVSTITSQTLSSYRQSTPPTLVNVSKLLESALSLYEGRLSSSGITVERRYAGSASLYAHDGELRQMFVNLIGNAFDATRNVGTKIIVCEREAVDLKTGGRGIRVTVADTGHGMNVDTLRQIFEPFFSTKGEAGSGLGLWITKGLVEKHHGSMRVRSSQEPQKHGTVFSIFFPFEVIQLDNQTKRIVSGDHAYAASCDISAIGRKTLCQ